MFINIEEGSKSEPHAKPTQILQDLVDKKKVPGISITVMKAGMTIYQEGFGHASLETAKRVDPQKTIFRIASVSKNIAATALAVMVKESNIDLDASFYDYVPYYPKKRYDFTIRQLANHTSGIRGYKGKEYALDLPYSIKEGIAIFADDELLFEPGSDFHYTSYNWVLVSLAMQEASGLPFKTYVVQKVLKPLALDNTFSDENKIQNADQNLARFYSRSLSGFRNAAPVDNRYKLAGGGYLSTSNDLAVFGNAILNGNLLDDTDVTPFLTASSLQGKSTYYGLGWEVSKDKQGRAYYGHVGNGVGGYANFFVYPKERLVFAILTNCTHPKIQEELDMVIDQIIRDS